MPLYPASEERRVACGKDPVSQPKKSRSCLARAPRGPRRREQAYSRLLAGEAEVRFDRHVPAARWRRHGRLYFARAQETEHTPTIVVKPPSARLAALQCHPPRVRQEG